jgi:hypothetical protein
LGLVLLAFWGVYLIAANSMLASGKIADLVSSGDAVKLRLAHAWSLWPGRVHVEGFQMTMQDDNVQFVLEIRSVDVNVRLGELTNRTFHATRVRGDGVAFRMRQRIQPETAGSPRVLALSPIPGFSDPPLRKIGPPTPPIPDSHYNLWTVHIEDVDVGVRELWFEEFRYQGEARAKGAFRLRPGRRLWVGPADLFVTSGDVTSASYDVLHEVKGKVDCRVEDFNVQKVEGLEVFRFISGRAKLNGALPGFDAFNFLFGPRPYTVLEGAGPVEANIAIFHGLFTPDTRFTYRTRHIGLSLHHLRLFLDGDTTVVASGPAEGRPAHIGLRTPQGQLRLGAGRYTAPEVHDLEADATTTSADITKHWSLGEATVHVGALFFHDLRWLNQLPLAATVPWVVQGGEGTASGSAALAPDGELRGWANASVEHASAARGEAQVMASADAGITFAATHGRLLEGDLDLAAREIAVGAIGSKIHPWATIETASLAGRLVGATAENQAATHDFKAHLGRTSFRWGTLEATAAGSDVDERWTSSFAQGQISWSRLFLKNAGGAPQSWHASVPAAMISGVLTQQAEQIGGHVRVEARKASGQVGRTKFSGDIVAQLAAVSSKYPLAADVSGAVLASNVGLDKGDRQVRGWWTQLTLGHVHVGLGESVELEAKGRARLQNGLPILYVLSSENESPNWLLTQLSRHTLTADLDIERYCGWTDVQIPLIEGGLLWAQGRVQTEPGATYGAMLFRLNPIRALSLGVVFFEDFSRSTPFVGAGWLNEQIVPMASVGATKRAAGCGATSPEPLRRSETLDP